VVRVPGSGNSRGTIPLSDTLIIGLLYAFNKRFTRLICGFSVGYSSITGRQRGGSMPTMNAVKIGSRLKELRERNLLTQVELGAAAGVSRDQVSRIERDEVDPRFSTIRKLARALEVDPSELTRK
jgi:DNA-binding XRE family transcriptional regulator